MPVDSTHPEYDEYISAQEKCNDAYAGEDAVKEKSTKYLPALGGMVEGDKRYLAYLHRAMFYSATKRTVDGLSGVVSRKPPILEMPDSFPWRENIDGTGESLQTFISKLTSNAILIGWQGVFIDRRKDYDYPYPIIYKAEQIINWEYENYLLKMVMLKDSVIIRDDDGYGAKEIEQWRELSIINSVYTVILWRKDAKNEFFVHDAYTPTQREEPLKKIPFEFISVCGEIENPPLLDMINVNFHHYQNSADYEHGLHFSGLPTPYIVGLGQQVDENGNNVPIELGSETILLIPEAGGAAGFMEVSNSFESHVVAMENKKTEMAALGARMLQSEKKSAETAEAARINRSGDSNVLSKIVISVENSVNNILKIMAEWEGLSPELFSVEINKDFVDAALSAQELTALVSAWQSGGMSQETLVHNLKKNEMLQNNRTIEEEISAIRSEAPNLNGGFAQ